MATDLNEIMARIIKSSMAVQKRAETYAKNMEIDASLPDDSYTIKEDIIVDKLISNVVKNTLDFQLDQIKNTFDFKADQTKNVFDFKVAQAENYAKAVGMDEANTKMLVIMETQGGNAAAKAMMEDCGGDYAAMRARYG